MAIATSRNTGSLTFGRHHFFATMQFGIVALMLLTLGCGKQSQKNAKTVEFKKSSEKHSAVPNFSKVSDDLYRGGQPTKAGYATLKTMGIRTIVTLRILDRYSYKLEQDGFRTYHLSFKHIHPETEDVLKFLDIVTKPGNKPVFVHCRQGADRTGMMIAIYRMAIQNWPRAKAIDEMKRMGFNDWNLPIERYILNVNIEELKQGLAEKITSEPVL